MQELSYGTLEQERPPNPGIYVPRGRSICERCIESIQIWNGETFESLCPVAFQNADDPTVCRREVPRDAS